MSMFSKLFRREIPVVVTTQHRGVFFGFIKENKRHNRTLNLQGARNCLYWSADVRGFLGLASDGPSETCRVGPSADITLQDVTCVAECTPVAVSRWEAAPWHMS